MPVIAAGYSVKPALWFARLNTEFELGQRLDVDAKRVGQGTVWKAEIQRQGSISSNCGCESTQQVNQGFINAVSATDRRRSLIGRATQWLGVLPFDACNALRVVWRSRRAIIKKAVDVIFKIRATAIFFRVVRIRKIAPTSA